MLVATTRDRRLLWGLAIVLTLVSFAIYAVQIPAGRFALDEPFFVNRVLAAVTMVVMTVLLHLGTLTVDALEASRETILRQNAELDARRCEAEDASHRKTRLLASVSHDIRTPLSTINLIAETIRYSIDAPGLQVEVPNLAKQLQANALSLAELLSDVLDISALDSGRIELHETTFSLNDLLIEQWQRHLAAAQAKRLRLTVVAPEIPVQLRTDRSKLDRVLGNLLGNAIKYTEAGEVTAITALGPDGTVHVRVRDTGIGIAAENLDRIFDEFAQLTNPDHDHSKGWGLGLAICRRLVESIGGNLTVESQPNQGSTFTLHIPSSCRVRQPRMDSAQRID